MSNVTRFDDEADNPAKSTDDIPRAKFINELRHRLDPILQGQDSRSWADKRPDRSCRLRHLPRFNTQDHEIDFANFIDVIRSFRRMNYEVPIRTINPEPGGFDR